MISSFCSLDASLFPSGIPLLHNFLNTTQTHKSRWFNGSSYRYLNAQQNPLYLTKLDIELSRMIFKKVGANLSIKNIPWKDYHLKLQNAALHYNSTAFYATKHSKFSYFSIPYYFEKNLFFVPNSNCTLKNYTVKTLIKDVKDNHLRLKITEEGLCCNNSLNGLIKNLSHKNYFQKLPIDHKNLALLYENKISSFDAHHIIKTIFLNNENTGSKINEFKHDSKATVHLLLSKESLALKKVRGVNSAIKDVHNSDEYVTIVSKHIYPIILQEITESMWFEVIQTIGIIAFALSGLILAYRYNTSFFGTFIIALIPSFGGGIMRDVIFGRYPIWFLSAKSYIISLIFIVMSGFFGIKLARTFLGVTPFKKFFPLKYSPRKIFKIVIVITDALGLATFTVVGVVVCLMVKADPLWLWGPFFAFLSGAGGTIIRDLILKDERVEILHGDPYAEITVIWGSVLSLYLTYSVYDINPINIKIAVIATIACAFISRLFIYFCKIPNIFFIQNSYPKQ